MELCPIDAMEPGEGYTVGERYRLTARVHGNDSESIFRATDLSNGRKIILEIFPLSLFASLDAKQAFERDLAVLRDASHPNIVQVLDFGEGSGSFYIALEDVEGSPLSSAKHLQTDKSSFALDVMTQLCEALAWLHARGVVHNDIREAAVLWNGSVKLTRVGPQRVIGFPQAFAADVRAAAAVVRKLLTGETPQEDQSVYAEPASAGELAGILDLCLNDDPHSTNADQVADLCRRLHPHSAGRPGVDTLAHRIGAQASPFREVLQWLLSVCTTLRRIHDEGSIHVDLTPSNIHFKEAGRLDIETVPVRRSETTLVVTDPKYAAPELLLAQTTMSRAAHEQSDVYALGLIAYELLAGRDAFRKQISEHSGELGSDLFWMKWHVDAGRHLPPLRELSREMPLDLSETVDRMLHKDPLERLHRIEDVEQRIKQLLQKLEPTESIEISCLVPPPSQATAQDKNRSGRGQKITQLAIASCLALLLILVAWMFGVERARPESTGATRSGGRVAAVARQYLQELLPSVQQPIAYQPPRRLETAGGPMVLVAAGKFVMGSSTVPNEGPARTVYLPAYYIDVFEVSNARYRSFTDATGYAQPPAPSWDPDYFAKGSLPVLNVSWRDAQAFCVAARKRLPSEPEWEKAARGSSPGSRFWANWSVDGLSNLKRAGFTSPMPVGSFQADVSPFGVYDMAGNVHEWVNDQYGLYSGNPVLLDQPGTAKVVRGGSFALSPQELSPSWRASRESVIDGEGDSPIGFRCAADVRSALETLPRRSMHQGGRSQQ